MDRMAILPILHLPDPILRQKAVPVGPIDDAVRRLLDDMLETMYAAPGVGLAAPQVGVARRLLVADAAAEGQPQQPLQLVDPELTWAAETRSVREEGCLSVPEHFAEVRRPDAVRVRYRDVLDRPQEIAADGLLARCLQHELDHLDGVLFVDHLTPLKRGMLLRKYAKSRRQRD